MSSEFEKLATELETLAKAQPATEEDKVLAAAKEAGVDTAAVGEIAEGAAGKAADGAAAAGTDGGAGNEGKVDDDEVLGKSFQVVGDDGKPVKAYDATELIKSLNERVAGLETGFEDVAERKEHLGKSLGLISDLLKSQSTQITQQAEQIATLQKSITDMGDQGRGRKAVITVTEKPAPAMTKSMQPEGLTGNAFMAKAMAAQKDGRITALDVSIAEGSLNRGIPVREDIVSRVMGNQ